MTTTEATHAPPLRGSDGQIFDLEPPATTKKSRLPEVAIGLLLVVGGALGALLWQLNATRTTDVLAAATEISRGDVIELSDLQAVAIRSDDDLNVLGRNEAAELVGRVALTDLAPGTLLTPEDVSETSSLGPDDGVVGLSLGAGQAPSLSLRPGDVVNVVLTPGGTDDLPLGGDEQADLAYAEGEVLVRDAVVIEARNLDQFYFVSLLTSESQASLIALAAAEDRVWLIEVASGGGS